MLPPSSATMRFLVRAGGASCRVALIASFFSLTSLPGPSWAANPKEPSAFLDHKAFGRPELSISGSHVPLEDILARLPNRRAWMAFREDPRHSRLPAFVDPRSGALSNLIGAFPLLPGSGAGNRLTMADVSRRLGRSVMAIDERAVADLVLGFVQRHRELLAIDTRQLGSARTTQVTPVLWQVSIPQQVNGVPVREGRLAATLSHGNLVVIGTETWGNARVNVTPEIEPEMAIEAGFAYVEGRAAHDEMLREPTLEIVPVAPAHQTGEEFVGPVGAGYEHRLVWTFVFRRPPDDARWEAMVDAHSGEVIAFHDINQYAQQEIKGGVYPLTDTEICPSAATCGDMQTGWPMPFADTGLPAPNDFTNSAGIFDYTSGTVTTTLAGRYVRTSDACGATSQSAAGSVDMLGSNAQHDCTTPGVGGAGNTPASRSAFYEVNRIAELARGWLPANTWLQSQLQTNVNIDNACNAFWDGVSINFYRSGGGCRNTGEIAAVFDHEWGHGLDDNDAAGALSNSSEAYADIAAIYRLQTSCVGYGFSDASADAGCGFTSDGTGANRNEAQKGASHCDTDCSGVRDADWAKHADDTPDTPQNFVCAKCSVSPFSICGRQTHCAAAPARQAAWDLVARDLVAAPFNYDNQTAFLIGSKLFYHGSGNVGSWHACNCSAHTSDGCGATNGYMQWLTADDDNGNLNDGTPHMTAIFAAFNRHNIACATPTPANSSCAGGPIAAPVLSATVGSYSVSLSWGAVTGVRGYGVFRTEGHAGCNFGKTLIALVGAPNTTYVDTQVAAGRTYYYNVVAGNSFSCFGPASNCASATP